MPERGHARNHAAVRIIIAVCVLVAGLAIAIWLPRYTCREPYRLVPASGPGSPSSGWLCMHTDMGYSPDSRLPFKWGIAGLTVVAAGVALSAGGAKGSG